MTQKDKRQVQKENRVVAVLLLMLLSSLIILSYAFSGADTESGNSSDSGNSGILSIFGISGNPGNRGIFSVFSGASSDAVIPTSDDIGKTVYVEGNVQSFRKTYTGDHLIITLLCSDGSEEELISVFIKKSAGAENISSAVTNGSRIGASGLVQEYNGSLELVVSKESDVFIRHRSSG